MKRYYWCPTCQNTTQETCDSSLTNTTCPKAELCMALWDENIFVRKCVNEKMLELFTRDCKKVNSNEKACSRKRKYHVSWCAQSGCKAKVSKTATDFWCPTCQNSTLKSCDASLTNTTCPKAEFCMAIQDKNIFARKCVNEKMLELFTKGCKKVSSNEKACSRKRKYHVSWCAQSGCKAKVSKTATDFWCPTCQNSTLKSCDASLTNTTCPKAEFCMAIQDKNIFARKCVNKSFLDLISKGCKHVGDKMRECNGKRHYLVTWCDKPGCRADANEIPKVTTEKAPEDSSFECPTCPICKSPEECDKKLSMTKCPKASRCMALRVKGTVVSKTIFSRNCVNEKGFLLIQRACTKKQGCEVSTCTATGCKAAL